MFALPAPTSEPTIAPKVEEEGGFPMGALIFVMVSTVLAVGGRVAYEVRPRTRR